MGNCSSLTWAQVLSIFVPIGIGPFMSEGRKSIVGWVQVLGVLFAISAPLIYMIMVQRWLNAEAGPDGEPGSAAREAAKGADMLALISGFVGIVLCFTWIISLKNIFSKYECTGKGVIVSRKRHSDELEKKEMQNKKNKGGKTEIETG